MPYNKNVFINCKFNAPRSGSTAVRISDKGTPKITDMIKSLLANGAWRYKYSISFYKKCSQSKEAQYHFA